MMPEIIKNPVEQERLRTALCTHQSIYGIWFYSLRHCLYWAAFYMSRWSWLAISGPGLYLVIAICAGLAI